MLTVLKRGPKGAGSSNSRSRMVSHVVTVHTMHTHRRYVSQHYTVRRLMCMQSWICSPHTLRIHSASSYISQRTPHTLKSSPVLHTHFLLKLQIKKILFFFFFFFATTFLFLNLWWQAWVFTSATLTCCIRLKRFKQTPEYSFFFLSLSVFPVQAPTSSPCTPTPLRASPPPSPSLQW